MQSIAWLVVVRAASSCFAARTTTTSHGIEQARLATVKILRPTRDAKSAAAAAVETVSTNIWHTIYRSIVGLGELSRK